MTTQQLKDMAAEGHLAFFRESPCEIWLIREATPYEMGIEICYRRESEGEPWIRHSADSTQF